MTTVSDEGERTCPLCAEEMDLTDQQLKPCKCGYEICVWCWHHIIDMAEKDDTDGRCPACRAPYDKERIVGMASNCERVVAEMSAEKKQKSQKAKPKTSAEARKHLNSVRVIQRNLVYIIGLPSNLADESMLERREYFGQYGKVLKVSVSRPASGAQQASNNNTFSVYITYAKEDEAVRCIQAVHNFVLEGKPLRACFGTTKYCHAWLRNMTCSNPDCLYLHDIGSHEDSFTKDEIISAYTRSRVPQIASNNLQRRLGNVLPPPADDFCINGTASPGKPVVKSSSYNCAPQAKVSAVTCGSAGRSTVLPAAASWGLRATNSRPPATSTPCFQGPVRQKAETFCNSTVLSSTVVSIKHTSAWHDDVVTASKIPEENHEMHSGGRSRPLEPSKPIVDRDLSTTATSQSAEVAHETLTSAWDDVITTTKVSEESHFVHLNGRSRTLETTKPCISRDPRATVSNLSAVIAHAKESSAWHDDIITTLQPPEESHAVLLNGRSRSLDSAKSCIGRDSPTAASDLSAEVVLDAAYTSGTSASHSSGLPAPEVKARDLIVPGNNKIPGENVLHEEPDRQSIGTIADKIAHGSTAVNGNIQSLCSGLSSVSIDGHSSVSHLNRDEHNSSVSHHGLTGLPLSPPSGLQQFHPEKSSLLLAKASVMSEDSQVSRDISNWSSAAQKQVLSPAGTEDILVADDDQRQRLSDAVTQSSYMPYSSQSLAVSNHSINHPWCNDLGSTCQSTNGDPRPVNAKSSEAVLPFSDNDPVLRNGYHESKFGSSAELGKFFERPDIISREEVKCIGRLNNVDKTASVDMGESSIISNILSMDFDPWDDSLTSANNFAKFLSETDKQNGSLKMSSSWKSQSSNQSRFSFARQEIQGNFSEPFYPEIRKAPKRWSTSQDSLGDGFWSGSIARNFEDPTGFTNGSSSFISSDRNSAASRAKVSAPPGFSAPNRAPPPGFSGQDRLDQAFNTTPSENHLLGSSLLRNQYQVPLTGNTDDVEFIDPAILAVGKGRLPLGVNDSGLDLRSFPTQFHASESDPRLPMLMQQSISARQDLRIPDHIGDRYLPLNDAYIPSRLIAQNQNSLSPLAQMSLQPPRNSHISNSQWDGWNNNIQVGNDISMAEMLRNERLGINKYFPGNEELQFSVPGNMYNRAFGM